GVDQPLDRVGDLELAARGGPDALDRVEHVPVEQVDADDGEIAARLARFLDHADDAPAVQLGDTEVLGVRHLFENDQRVRLAGPETLDQGHDAAADEVVAEEEDEAVVAEEVAGNLHAVGDAE